MVLSGVEKILKISRIAVLIYFAEDPYLNLYVYRVVINYRDQPCPSSLKFQETHPFQKDHVIIYILLVPAQLLSQLTDRRRFVLPYNVKQSFSLRCKYAV